MLFNDLNAFYLQFGVATGLNKKEPVVTYVKTEKTKRHG